MKREATTLLAALAMVACGGARHAQGQGGIVGTWTIERAMGMATTGAETEPFIVFSEDGRMNGNASVNLFFGDYTLDGTHLRADNVGMTRRMGASMEVERAVTDAINSLSAVSVSGDSAFCLGPQGDTLLWLRRKE